MIDIGKADRLWERCIIDGETPKVGQNQALLNCVHSIGIGLEAGEHFCL